MRSRCSISSLFTRSHLVPLDIGNLALLCQSDLLDLHRSVRHNLLHCRASVAHSFALSPFAATALAPSATTEYAPLDRPGTTPSSSSTAQPTIATTLETIVDAPAEGTPAAEDATSSQPAGDASAGSLAVPAVVGLVPHGSLTPLEYQQAPNAQATIDVNAVMKDAQGNDLFDIDIDSLEDKPWRKPGANPADYFNYGMNEAAWKNYAMKQRKVRDSESVEKNPFAVSPQRPLGATIKARAHC